MSRARLIFKLRNRCVRESRSLNRARVRSSDFDFDLTCFALPCFFFEPVRPRYLVLQLWQPTDVRPAPRGTG